MGEATPDQGAAGNGGTEGSSRVRFETLRERTDELELIISGLSLLALISIPEAIWATYEEYFGRMSLNLAAASAVALPLITAICHTMVMLLVVHLAVRAYWVGMIGLKAAFPVGVRWERLQGMGPVTLERLKARTKSLDASIASADLVASTLFSLINYTALALAALGFWFAVLFGVASVFGAQLGGVNSFVNRAVPGLVLCYLGAPFLRWLLDGVVLRRFPRLTRIAPLRWLVRALAVVESLFLPTRWLGVTRLTLQSHLLPRAFLAVFTLVVVFALYGSTALINSGRIFDPLGTQTYVSGRDTAGGLRSFYYETHRTARDRLRPTPLIPSPVIESHWLPVFLPYVALIDDPVLAQRCADPPSAPPAITGFDPRDSDAAALKREAEIDAQSAKSAACLRKLWELKLDGEVQSLESFQPAERGDLNLRGLAGWIALSGQPGPRRLEAIWRPRPEQDALTDDYVPRRTRHVIPFLWSPELESPTPDR